MQSLKIHPRDSTENMLILSIAEKLYEDIQGEKRSFLASMIKEFIITLEKQEPKLILIVREKLRQLIHELRSDLITI